MSAIVSGAIIKKNCYLCDFSEFIDTDCAILRCNLTGHEVDKCSKTRHVCCPLSEISSPHGRLIDATELLRQSELYLSTMSNEFFKVSIKHIIKEIVSNTPTVVEAEV